MSDTMTDTEGTMILPGDIEAETLGYRISKIYRAVTCALVPNDQMTWPVAHDADGTFYDRAEHRAIVEELTKLAHKLNRQLTDVFRVLSYDGSGTLAQIPIEPYDREKHPWPRLIITNPTFDDVRLLTSQIIEDIENGGHADLALREKYEQEEMDIEVSGLWKMMDVADRLDLLNRYDAHPALAVFDKLPGEPDVIFQLEQWICEAC